MSQLAEIRRRINALFDEAQQLIGDQLRLAELAGQDAAQQPKPEQADVEAADRIMLALETQPLKFQRQLLIRELAAARRRGGEQYDRTHYAINFHIAQPDPSGIEAFIWSGPRPNNLYSSRGRVTKHRDQPALVTHTQIFCCTVEEAEDAIAILAAAINIARRLDEEYPDGVPPRSKYPPMEPEQ